MLVKSLNLTRGAGVGVATTDSFLPPTAASRASHHFGTVNRTHVHTSQCNIVQLSWWLSSRGRINCNILTSVFPLRECLDNQHQSGVGLAMVEVSFHVRRQPRQQPGKTMLGLVVPHRDGQCFPLACLSGLGGHDSLIVHSTMPPHGPDQSTLFTSTYFTPKTVPLSCKVASRRPKPLRS